MRLERYPAAAAFLADAEPFLLTAEVENTVIFGVTRQLAAGAAATAIEPYFAVVRDDADVLVAAFQNLPTKLGVTRALRPDALALLAADIHTACPALRGVHGPEPTAGALAEQLAALRGGRARCRMRQRLYELRRVARLQRRPRGRLRPARPSDGDVLARWVAGFLHDVGEEPRDPAAIVGERLANDQLYVWDDGGPRSMAAWAGQTPNGVRVNYVYTPPALRGHGYASATVADLSQLLLDRGNQHCCLFTDLANPTSNSIYQRIGYRPVTDAAAYLLDSGPS